MIVTDMNDRERKKFAGLAEELARSADKLAAALRTEDDSDVLFHLAMTGISGRFINDLSDIFKDAAGVQIPDSPSTLTPPSARRKDK
jgi:hypothetical protein